MDFFPPSQVCWVCWNNVSLFLVKDNSRMVMIYFSFFFCLSSAALSTFLNRTTWKFNPSTSAADLCFISSYLQIWTSALRTDVGTRSPQVVKTQMAVITACVTVVTNTP